MISVNIHEVAEVTAAIKEPGKKRALGLAKGEFEIPDSFFEPMIKEELALWYDSPILSVEVPSQKP